MTSGQTFDVEFKDISTEWLVEVYEKPNCFDHLKDPNMRYIAVFDKNLRLAAYIAFRIFESYVIIHLELMQKITHNRLKHFRHIFESEFIPLMKEFKAKKLWTGIEADETTSITWPKFIKQFGFNDIHIGLTSGREI